MRELFHINDDVLIRLGFEIFDYESDVTGVKYKEFSLPCKYFLLLVVYKYTLRKDDTWELVNSDVVIYVSGKDLITKVSSIEELKLLYKLLTGQELKEVKQ